MENWCYDEKTVYDSGLARHYETGEPLPRDLFAKLCAQKTYQVARASRGYLPPPPSASLPFPRRRLALAPPLVHPPAPAAPFSPRKPARPTAFPFPPTGGYGHAPAALLWRARHAAPLLV